MGINLNDGFDDLLAHVGHKIEIVTYGGKGSKAANVAIECETCYEVLVDFDNPGMEPVPGTITEEEVVAAAPQLCSVCGAMYGEEPHADDCPNRDDR